MANELKPGEHWVTSKGKDVNFNLDIIPLNYAHYDELLDKFTDKEQRVFGNL